MARLALALTLVVMVVPVASVRAADATSLQVQFSGSSITAGDPVNVTVTALDINDQVDASYAGTIHFDSSDSSADLPNDYTFDGGDNGIHAFSITLKTAGSRSVTATDTGAPGIDGTDSITVQPGDASDLIVDSFQDPSVAGASHTFTVTAMDAFGNVATGYTGTVHITSSDGAALLPGNYHFTGGDNGSHQLSATLNTSGNQSITATDIATSSINGSQPGITVNGGALDHFAVAGFTDPTVAGVSHTFTVTAKDSSDNTLTGYTGTVTLDSTDSQATFSPSTYHFVSGDNGTHSLSGTLKTVGTAWVISATDGGASGTQTGIAVTPAAAASLDVSGFQDPTVAGVSHPFTVTALDAFDNVATGYTGTVDITSSDGLATLPANYHFVSGDSGVQQLNATLNTSGNQSITATDTVTSSITGDQTGITVGGGSLDHFLVTGFADPVVAGVADSFLVTAKDSSGNTVAGYTGTVTLDSTDVQGVFPASPYHFVVGDNGAHTFTGTLKTVGTNWVISATDGGASGTQTGIAVTPAAAASLAITTSYPDPTAAGVVHPIGVTLTDAFGNVATGYRGTVHLSSSDLAATVPGNHAFSAGDAGTANFSVTLRTSGSQSITIEDIGNAALTDTQTGITVSANAAASLVVSGYPDPVGLNTSGSVTVVAKDGSGNTATGYLGTIHLTTSGGAPTLPTNYTFKVSDNGVHVLSGISFGTPGGWTLTATDTVTSSVTGSQLGITVTNLAPSCTSMSKAISEDHAFSDVMGAFCSDPDGGPGPLTYSNPSNPAHGTITLFQAATGSFTYTPDLGYVGTDSFTATVSDGNSPISVTYNVTITALNDAPVFVPGADQSVFEDAPAAQVNAWATGIGPGGGLDEAGQALNFIVTNNHNPFFSVQPAINAATGNLTFTLAPNANGDVTVSVRLHDNGGTVGGGIDTSATITFDIAVTPVNDPPTFTLGPDPSSPERTGSTTETLAGWATGLSVGPNESGQTLISFTTGVDLPGLFIAKPAVATNGTLTYTPAPHRNGIATVTVSLQDDGGVLNGGVDTTTQTFTITITGVDDPPIAVNDQVTVVAGSRATTIPILANDNANNPDQGEVLKILSATRPKHGTVSILPGGLGLKYKPVAGYHGADQFDYSISDPAAHTDSAHVVVAIPRDTFKPVMKVPGQAIVGLQTIGTRTVAIRVSWAGSDLGSGIARYEVYRSKNGGRYVRVPLGRLTAHSVTQLLSVNGSYRFKVRAVDKAGNVGLSVAGPAFKVLRPQETPTSALTYAGTWSTANSAKYSGGHVRASATALDSVTYAFTGRNVAWVAPRSIGRGSATILIDGIAAGTVNLQSTKATYGRVVLTRTFAVSGPHTFQIVLVGTVGHPRVDVDAFVVLQ